MEWKSAQTTEIKSRWLVVDGTGNEVIMFTAELSHYHERSLATLASLENKMRKFQRSIDKTTE